MPQLPAVLGVFSVPVPRDKWIDIVLALHLKKHIFRYHGKGEDEYKSQSNRGRNHRVNITFPKQQFSKTLMTLKSVFLSVMILEWLKLAELPYLVYLISSVLSNVPEFLQSFQMTDGNISNKLGIRAFILNILFPFLILGAPDVTEASSNSGKTPS